MQRTFQAGIRLALLSLFLLPTIAAAQSQISGQVKDESGAVLPGVSVEAASPVLIEKSKSVVTDDQGRYTVVDLRPGTYKVSFSLLGFSTVVRDAIELPGNFTATVNAEMKVGALEETVTVSGQPPTVDVQQASRAVVLSRDIIDALPTTRNIMAVGMLVPGVRLGTQDVGGSNALSQSSPRVHGVNQTESVQMVDGMSIQTSEDCVCQVYQDEAIAAEVTVTTSAIPAEVAAGGMRTNSIPKDGGNTVSGAVFVGGTNGTWQSDNVDDYLRSLNIKKADRISHIQNFNASMGGPLVKDTLWYFMAARHIAVDKFPANVDDEYIVAPDGEVIRAVNDQLSRNGTLRLTWQINDKMKLAPFVQRLWKEVGNSFVYGQDPRTGQQRDPTHANNFFGTAKWTYAATSKMLFEGGYATTYQNMTQMPVIGTGGSFIEDRSNPLFYTRVEKADTALNINPQCPYSYGCTSWGSSNAGRTQAEGRIWSASMAYVTGSHNFKFGFQDKMGVDDVLNQRNGDLIANYVNNKPSTVTVYNTPANQKVGIHLDLGIFVQDSWTIKRLTVSPGLRIQWFNASATEVSLPAGRFAPARFYAEQKNLPNWPHDVAPRLAGAYDLFGNGRTALKVSAGKYYVQQTGFWTKVYANSGQSTDSRAWFDCGLNAAGTACSGAALATDNDGIVQDNEIGPSSTSTFGLRSDRNPAPDIKRMSNWEYSTAVQHQIASRISVGLAWYHRSWRDLQVTDRTLISTSDYSSFTLPMPSFSTDPTLTGVLDPNAVLTIYNLNAAKKSVFGSALIDFSSKDRSVYNGFETSFSARLPRGSTVFGGWTADRNISTFCSNDDDPNGVTTTDKYLGETVLNGGPFCDQRKFKMPFKNEFKVAGNLPLVYGFDMGAALQSYTGLARVITWSPAATLFPAPGRTNAETIVLNKPGSLYYPRYNQLDLNIKKNFRSGQKTFTFQVDCFNVLNSNAILTMNNAIGATLGQVNSIQLGRTPRIAFQMKF
jgi:hypothetical protein